jgi:hypothetical protein
MGQQWFYRTEPEVVITTVLHEIFLKKSITVPHGIFNWLARCHLFFPQLTNIIPRNNIAPIVIEKTRLLIFTTLLIVLAMKYLHKYKVWEGHHRTDNTENTTLTFLTQYYSHSAKPPKTTYNIKLFILSYYIIHSMTMSSNHVLYMNSVSIHTVIQMTSQNFLSLEDFNMKVA